MPAPVKTEKSEPEVKVIPSEPTQEPEKIEIDAGTGQPVTPSSPVPPSVSPDDFNKALRSFGYELRKQRQDFEAALARFVPQAPVKTEKPQHEVENEFGPDLDVIAQQDWKRGVSMIAEKKAEQIAEKKFKAMMEERDKTQQEMVKTQALAQRIARSTQRVLDRYPSLNDENSEEFKTYYQMYSQILAEDPDLDRNPRGPELVMFEMERKTPQNNPANLEAERLKRVAAGGVPAGRNISAPKKTFQLTTEEIEFCKTNKLSPARYAAMKEANYKEGVEA